MNIKEKVKRLIDETTLEILTLATREGYYPNQIARELGLSNSLVVTKLKELERLGIIWGRFESRGGKAVKMYYLLEKELTLKIDLLKGKLSLIGEEPSKIKEIVSKKPELFQDYENYLLWSRGKMRLKDIAESFNVTLDEAREISQAVSGNLEGAFLAAYETEIKNWREGVETTFYDLKEDALVIPTHRIESQSHNLSSELISEISKGEAYLSALKKQFPTLKVDEIKELEKRKMVVIEEMHLPHLNFAEIRKVTQEKLKKDNRGLFNFGRKTGERMARFVGGEYRGLFEGLFKDAHLVKTGGKEKVIIPGCHEHIGAQGNEKACYFIAGLIEGLLQGKGEEVLVYEEACGAQGARACEFIISPKEQMEESVSSRRVKKLLLGD